MLLALVALVLGTAPTVQADDKECEVCGKVIDTLKATKKLSTKDNKLCYNLEPLKKDVARRVSFKKDSFKICKSLEKKHFCSMRYPVKTDANADYSKMRVKQLLRILGERGVECAGCVEKADFIAKIKETESLHSEL
ncbi:hypothetical protein V7S43_007302 [Phytophthora oleae]|uniref:Mesencephalic astrocyte-derived neurotrophic factor homolog n=1 Tax=Phytophthora oleae TaxID=2107226 RepID=A0ABD3FQ49_9STRA